MAPVKIVTDSSHGLPPEVIREYDIHVVPISVQLGEETFQEGVDLSLEAYYSRLAAGEMPKTAAPAPGAFVQVYQKLVEEGSSIISIHLSGKASSTNLVAESVKKFFPQARIDVVDSRALTLLLGYQVLEAARAVRAGKNHDEVLQVIEKVKKNEYGYVVLPTLKYIQRSGRITKGQALLGSLLNIKPILYFEQGELLVLEKARTYPQAVKRALDLLKEKVKGRRFALGILHGNDPAQAEAIAEDAAKMMQWDELYIGDVGTSIASHGGPGMIVFTLYLKE